MVAHCAQSNFYGAWSWKGLFDGHLFMDRKGNQLNSAKEVTYTSDDVVEMDYLRAMEPLHHSTVTAHMNGQ
ncbi:hypothetical protein Tco_1185503 [Tanacetum coccineum]